MIKIFLETGKKTTSEYVFVKTFLKHIVGPNWGNYFEIETTNGKDNIANFAPSIRANSLEGGKNILLFDADFVENAGGFMSRKQELEKKKSELDLEFDFFLFPTNKDDGDVETIFENIALKDKYAIFFDCFHDYETCLGKAYEHPNRKGKIFAYISSIMTQSASKRAKLGQGEWQFDNVEYWNLDADYLTPLRQFVLGYILPSEDEANIPK